MQPLELNWGKWYMLDSVPHWGREEKGELRTVPLLLSSLNLAALEILFSESFDFHVVFLHYNRNNRTLHRSQLSAAEERDAKFLFFLCDAP